MPPQRPSAYRGLCPAVCQTGAHDRKRRRSNLALRATKRLLSVPQCLKPSRPTRSPATSIHRCFLISEIFCLILEFIQQSDEPSEEGECREDRTLGKRSLASVARTCRAFSVPALDLLWMRLDSLDPLIKVLPSRIWAKKHSRFVVRLSDPHLFSLLDLGPCTTGPGAHGR